MKPLLIILLVAFAALALTVQAQKPLEGGADVLGADSFAAFGVPQSDAVKVEVVRVSGQSFDRAWRVTGVKPVEQTYSVQLSAGNKTAIKRGDVMIVQFWARSIGSSAQTEFVFELGREPWDKSISAGVRLKPAWTQFSMPFRAGMAFAVGEAAANFRLGYVNQSFELGGVVLKNYATGKDISSLPIVGFDYAGRDQNAAWRAAAAKRIDQLRKADLRVNVVDANGQPVKGAQVKLEMQRQAFPFGSAVDARRLLGTGADSEKYRELVVKLFNRVVLENDLKWPGWESEYFSKTRTLEALKFFADKGIPVRGHNLVWPCNDEYCLPADVPGLFNDPAKLRARIDSHFQDILGATKGQIVEWDVINEPSANKRLANVLGEDEMAVWLKRARALDPKAKLLINDYGNMGECCGLETEFKRIVKRMLELNAPLDGLGLQGHFGWNLTPPEELYARLDDLAQFKLPLTITEFDINITSDALQADYMRDFMTLAFSHPAVNGILMWGFWAGQHWLPDAALYAKDWRIRPHGQAWLDLVFKTWWTKVAGSSDASGVYGTQGFQGTYTVTASAAGKTAAQTVKLGPDGTTVTLTLK